MNSAFVQAFARLLRKVARGALSMVRNFVLLTAASLVLGACATSSDTPNNFAAERGIFTSPYAAPEIDRRAVGPGVLDEHGRWRRWDDDLLYPGGGEFAYDREGNRVRLSRRELRELCEVYFANQAQAVQDERIAEFNAQQASASPAPPPPQPSAPPVTNTGDGETPR
ncbi:chorismate mutase [Erythrobacter sp. NAP1]|nr:chorismate mutase [Erythrobacter sp. NAP1]